MCGLKWPVHAGGGGRHGTQWSPSSGPTCLPVRLPAQLLSGTFRWPAVAGSGDPGRRDGRQLACRRSKAFYIQTAAPGRMAEAGGGPAVGVSGRRRRWAWAPAGGLVSLPAAPVAVRPQSLCIHRSNPMRSNSIVIVVGRSVVLLAQCRHAGGNGLAAALCRCMGRLARADGIPIMSRQMHACGRDSESKNAWAIPYRLQRSCGRHVARSCYE